MKRGNTPFVYWKEADLCIRTCPHLAHIYLWRFFACFKYVWESQSLNSMKLVIPLHELYWSIHTKDESKRGTAFAFIFCVNWLWRCGGTAPFRVSFHEIKCNGMTSFMEFVVKERLCEKEEKRQKYGLWKQLLLFARLWQEYEIKIIGCL